MTNTRSLAPTDAKRIVGEVVDNALAAAKHKKVDVTFVSRSDSTLRGHFPLEPNAIVEKLHEHGTDIDGIILVPAFPEAGRVTIEGTHYSRVGHEYIEVGDSEFAQDATFGFTSSRLADWVHEKTGGKVPAHEVYCPSLVDVRERPEKIVDILMSLTDCQIFAPDCACEEDLRAISIALIRAEARGKKFIYRVGPPFMRARIGQELRPPLTRDEVDALKEKQCSHARGGLIVVGSHVAVTTAQFNHLLEHASLERIEIDVERIIEEDESNEYIQLLIAQASELLYRRSLLISTSRKVKTGKDKDDSLRIARLVSDAVVHLVNATIRKVRPQFVIAKGGITSSDIASRGLEMRHAMCIGPMLDGIISLWIPEDGLLQSAPYVVFPGNVGDEAALTQVLNKLE